jgi:hypothetical protein
MMRSPASRVFLDAETSRATPCTRSDWSCVLSCVRTGPIRSLLVGC